jgi:hypothetical protein
MKFKQFLELGTALSNYSLTITWSDVASIDTNCTRLLGQTLCDAHQIIPKGHERQMTIARHPWR